MKLVRILFFLYNIYNFKSWPVCYIEGEDQDQALVREPLSLLESKLQKFGNIVHDSVPISKDEVVLWHIDRFNFSLRCLVVASAMLLVLPGR